VDSGNALTLSRADLPTTNCPPQTMAVVVAKSTPSVAVLVLTRLLGSFAATRRVNDLRGADISWYRCGTIDGMAMNLRLTEAESDALRRKAAEEGRSMQEVARAAIAEYVSDRPPRLRAAIERVRTEDAELLDRLSR
jgi:hypothetical protein